MPKEAADRPKGKETAGTEGRRASDRGRYGRLSRERVLAAALDVVDRDGLSGLSMRKLGAELGVEAMALYRYAAGKGALLDGLVEAFCEELEGDLAAADPGAAAAPGSPAEPGAPAKPGAAASREAAELEADASREAAEPEADAELEADAEPEADAELEAEAELEADAEPQADDWRRELHRIALATYRVAQRHPNMVPLLATRLLSTPLARRPAAVLRSDERILALLHDAGLGDRRTVQVHRAFTAWLLGYLLVELRAMDDEPGEPDPAFRLGLHRMPAQEFPRLRATAISLDGQGGPEQLAAGLDALLGT
ncbi:TetR/AcrR family transcriptional regulator C-terminal domain-containing protein [Streptomyces durmitorensis]|uniref:TetR/AcrR family transcriptional regulator C-terminal domain-containing protein n=1 Tax=Streptomyces durmitorensis TaxID=319947 RepID=A0ABY4Q932_9ACTN|nr:TetR/AcrR family transcriptional regulator C-terminal domain-containing protein [Streptomyces durmitorensis]UQT61849.1 TetR/AcrR family transcriptional regulator C-terminal domain-containing protein [Streptomyces durmitorensis]